MEKKAPEKKVLLRDEDVFYVYDKRINKCVKEGCDGTVKYGLILKVNMPNGDTLNTFECNKCHMKYTAYPNYVRLSSSGGLAIYNQDEVTARDRKRASDAAKQEARERKKELAKQYAAKKTGNKPYGKKPYGKENGEKRPYEKKSFDRKPYDQKTYGKKPYKKSYDQKLYGKNSYDNNQSDRNRDHYADEGKNRNYRKNEYRDEERSAYDKKGNNSGYQKRYYKNPKSK